MAAVQTIVDIHDGHVVIRTYPQCLPSEVSDSHWIDSMKTKKNDYKTNFILY